jgi:hypothetical protein
MNEFFTQNNLLVVFWFTAGIVSIIELLEYLVTKNIPWLFRLMRGVWRGIARRFSGGISDGSRQLIINFSGHPVLPGQQKDIGQMMHWPTPEIINVSLGNVAEDHNFVSTIEKAVEKVALSPEEWQSTPIVVIAAGYSAVWSVVLAELHGRLGYFPDVVRLRPASTVSNEKFEVAEIMNLREIRHNSRDKRE